MKNRKQNANLNVQLSNAARNLLNNTLKIIGNLSSLSMNELSKEILEKRFNSLIMSEIFNMLTLEEKPKAQTYKDASNHMTIAVGLDIQPPHHSDAKAVLLSVNPHWDFEDMQKNINRPT